MNDWKIGTRITAGFGVIVAITFALGVYAYTRTVNIKSSEAQLAEDYLPSVAALSNINNNQYKQVDLLVRHAASSSDAEMDSLEAQMNELKEENNKSYAAYEATRSNAEETALYEKVKVEKAKFRDDMEAIRKLSRINTPATNKQALDKIDNELRPELTVYAAAMHNLIAYDMKGCQDGLGLINGAVGSAEHGMLIGILVSVALAAPIVLFVVRSITRPIGEAVEAIDKLAGCDLTVTLDNDSGDEIGQMARSLNSAIEKLRTTLEQVTASAQSASSSSQELSSAAETLASGAQEQASSLEETSASLEQITATVRQSADNARQASQIASSSRESAERGQDVVTSAVHAMEEINVASAKISDIISTIDEIAFQTNLLAVNAAVEAARAGEEGRGFAVVASEVRSLAQRSAGAAKEIKALIQDSLRKVEKGSELVNRSGETLLSIVGSVKKVTDIVGEIAAAVEEQSTGVDQVNTAVTQIDQVTQQNSAQTEELSSTAQTLSDQSARLLKLVSIFTLETGGGDFVARLEPAPVRKAVPVRPRATRPGSTLARKPARAHRPSGGAEVPAALLSAQSHASASADSFEEF